MFVSPNVLSATPPGLETWPRKRVQNKSLNIFVKNTKFWFVLAKIRANGNCLTVSVFLIALMNSWYVFGRVRHQNHVPKHQPIAKKLYRSHFLPQCNTFTLGRSCLKKVEGSWCTLMLVGACTNACWTKTVLAIFPFNNKEAKRLHCPIHLPLMEHLQCFL